ncbi:hypothetical protein B0J13DRAFT_448083 [Dactylonectria estremocensis]|uniref:DUF7053 domain-containing protein n=1 Tax=Dactylonectria estremocensis TaxID=1079267 RepID=A0A9P9EKH6_9HYPO|nr:hypothetical protein B0J13DRAFT_448083 [Dactylonectria estremocensis]
MRVQHHFSVTIPVPNELPPHLLIGWLQSYTPTLQHNFSVAHFEEIPSDPDSIADDTFIGPWDDTVRTFHVHEIYAPVTGLTTRMQWPAVYRCVPDGVRLRVSAPNGNTIRSQWTVRACQDDSSPSQSGSSSGWSATESADKWELYDEGYLEGHRLLMPFSSRYIDMVHNRQSQDIVDEALKAFRYGLLR